MVALLRPELQGQGLIEKLQDVEHGIVFLARVAQNKADRMEMFLNETGATWEQWVRWALDLHTGDLTGTEIAHYIQHVRGDPEPDKRRVYEALVTLQEKGVVIKEGPLYHLDPRYRMS